MTGDEQEALFEYWLHSECGYSYLGENSLYDLTLAEIRKLQKGFEIKKEREQEEIEDETPHRGRGTGGRVRESDREALQDFKQEHGLH